MKKLLLSAVLLISSVSAFCAVTLRYQNKDYKGYNMRLVIDGTDKEVKFENATASVTIQGGNRVCVIETRCGKIELADGDIIVIQDGCIRIDK